MEKLQEDKKRLFGNALRTEREKRGISRYYVARQTNIAEATVRSIEDGTRSVGIDILIKYLDVIGASLTEVAKNYDANFTQTDFSS